MFGRLTRLFGKKPALTRESLAAMPPKKLCFKVLYSLPEAEDENASQRAFVDAILLNGEVRNGGFNQYYYNTGDRRDQAEQAFRTMGADDLADIVRQANDCYEAHREHLESLWDGTMKGFAASYREDLFGRFDRDYYDRADKKRFFRLVADFVRARADDFIPPK